MRGYPIHYRMVNVVYPLNANSNSPPQVITIENVSRHGQMSPPGPGHKMALVENDCFFLHLPIPLPVCWVCPCLTLRVLPVYTPGESVSAPMCSALGVCLCGSVGLLCLDSLYTCLCGAPG